MHIITQYAPAHIYVGLITNVYLQRASNTQPNNAHDKDLTIPYQNDLLLKPESHYKFIAP